VHLPFDGVAYPESCRRSGAWAFRRADDGQLPCAPIKQTRGPRGCFAAIDLVRVVCAAGATAVAGVACNKEVKGAKWSAV
jgi:hypothetical protein